MDSQQSIQIEGRAIERSFLERGFVLWIGFALLVTSLTTAVGENNYTSGKSKFRSILDLPDTVEAPKGKLTLYADYSDQRKEGIGLYLVNRTGKEIRFNLDAGSFPVRLEARNAQGKWKLAQSSPKRNIWDLSCWAQHETRIENDTFLPLQGYFPSEGEKQAVRFRIYSRPHFQVFSNVGDGFIDPQQVEKARFDTLAIRTAEVKTLKRIIDGDLIAPDIDPSLKPGEAAKTARVRAVSALSQIRTPEAFDLLESVLKSGESDRDVLYASHWTLTNARGARIYAGIIQNKKSPNRTGIVEVSCRYFKSPILFPLYSKILEDYNDPAWKAALEAFAQYRTSEVKQRLIKLSKDERNPKHIREEARIQYWSNFSNDVFSISLKIKGSKVGTVSLKNISDQEFEFAYREPDEIIKFTAYRAQRYHPLKRKTPE